MKTLTPFLMSLPNKKGKLHHNKKLSFAQFLVNGGNLQITTIKNKFLWCNLLFLKIFAIISQARIIADFLKKGQNENN